MYTVGLMKNGECVAFPTTLDLDCCFSIMDRIRHYCHIKASVPGQAIEMAKARLLLALRRREQGKYVDMAATNEEAILSCNTLRQAQDMATRSFIIVHLMQNRWNVSKTSRGIEINRKSLTRLIKKYGLKRP